MSVIKIRKKPVVVEAIQWNGDNEETVRAFAPDCFFKLSDQERLESDDPADTAQVYDKLHSTWIPARTGQWIIRGVKGEFYPCDDEVLEATYDRLDS